MLARYAYLYSEIAQQIEHSKSVLLTKSLVQQTDELSIDDAKNIRKRVATFREACVLLPETRRIVPQVDRVIASLTGPPMSMSGTLKDLDHLLDRLHDELKSEFFYHVRSELVPIYNDREPFGAAVASRFADSTEDIEHAGQCLTLGQPTASVFHLMRAVEAAVGALCTTLSIPNPDREWGKLLSSIDEEIKKMDKDDRRNRWSEARSNLYHVKEAWRNGTMHPKQTYTHEQAKQVYDAMRVFMTQLTALV